jgi:hypothetical protein
MLLNKWGQGQLFAFSALESESYFTDDFTGTLSGDKVGVIFYTRCRRTLFFGNMNKFVMPEFECVISDMISQKTLLGNNSIIFAERHLIVGEYCDLLGVFVSADGECEVTRKGDVEIHNTKDGEYTAILRRDGRYAFAFGKSEDAAVELCEKGITIDIDELKEKKKKPYENGLPDDNKYASLYAKCISVMRSQLYSPEGNIKRIWSTPDRMPHRNMWLWDSVFHAIGHRNVDPALAESLILALFDVQRQDGFIPHMARPDYISEITQPPIIAWGAWLVYEKSGNKDFLRAVFENNKRFLLWCKDNRRDTEKELYTWYTNEDANNRCDESGMDNSPRFDIHSRLFAIDFSCYMANDIRYMQKIAEALSDSDATEDFGSWYGKVKDDINSTLWCEDDSFYYDYDITNDCFNKVESVSSFLPLFAGICDEDKATKLIAHLKNPESFYTEFPVPTISKKDKYFGTDLWRGPVWVNYNYMIIKGLREYGYVDFADEIKGKTLDVVDMWYKRTGTVYEFYDSENSIPPFCFNRKGAIYEPYDFRVKYQTIRDYGWSITLTFDLLNE